MGSALVRGWGFGAAVGQWAWARVEDARRWELVRVCVVVAPPVFPPVSAHHESTSRKDVVCCACGVVYVRVACVCVRVCCNHERCE